MSPACMQNTHSETWKQDIFFLLIPLHLTEIEHICQPWNTQASSHHLPLRAVRNSSCLSCLRTSTFLQFSSWNSFIPPCSPHPPSSFPSSLSWTPLKFTLDCQDPNQEEKDKLLPAFAWNPHLWERSNFCDFSRKADPCKRGPMISPQHNSPSLPNTFIFLC